MLVTPIVENPQVARQPEKETELFETEVRVGKMASSTPRIRGLDQTLLHIERRRLNALAQEKLLLAGKAVHRGNQP